MNTKVTFKTSDDREIENPGEEIWKLAKRMQAANPTMNFTACRDLVLESEPILARAYITGED